MRLLCNTNYCTLLAAQLGHARRAIATLTAERDAARDEAARLRAALDTARADKELYYDMFCAEMTRRANGLK